MEQLLDHERYSANLNGVIFFLVYRSIAIPRLEVHRMSFEVTRPYCKLLAIIILGCLTASTINLLVVIHRSEGVMLFPTLL